MMAACGDTVTKGLLKFLWVNRIVISLRGF
jgi:hypothetical protein